MSKLPVFLLVASVLSVGIGMILTSHRHVLIPMGLAALFAAFLVEKLQQRKPQQDLSAMSLVRERWAALSTPSREIRLSDRWDLASGVTVESPAELTVFVTFLQDSHFKVVKSVELIGRGSGEFAERTTIAVDTGLVYAGDANPCAVGVHLKAIARMIDTAFDHVADRRPLMLVIPTAPGPKCGLVIASGLGDGRYEVAWECHAEVWRLEIAFL